jgi:hypothetical protein
MGTCTDQTTKAIGNRSTTSSHQDKSVTTKQIARRLRMSNDKQETVYDIIAGLKGEEHFASLWSAGDLEVLADRLEKAMEIDQDYRRVSVHTLGEWLKDIQFIHEHIYVSPTRCLAKLAMLVLRITEVRK